MFNPNKAMSPPTPPTYAWDEHPEALLGVIYLYFSSNCNPAEIGDERMQAFIELHQDANGTLTDKQVITAVQAVRGMDGRSGPRPSKTLMALWDALSPLRDRLPVYAYREPVATKKDAADEPPDVAALLA